MQRPRRTTEFETPSTAARQSRPSRLQQPLRRPSVREGSLRRSSSAEPNLIGGGTANHLTVLSSTKRQRRSSASNARTPQRTPTHITPSKVSQFTGEKQRPPVNDKRWIQEQVVKITEYLKTVDCGFSTDFLHRGGLKTMSIKQFIGLVNYFLKFVAGNKFKIVSNHVESISKILEQIEYPYTMNKSWLKTPTAPHAFGNAVMLFSYFMEFIPPPNLDSLKKNCLIVSEEFPDMDFAFKLFTMTNDGFDLWNNQKNEECEKLQNAAVDELIYKKISIAGAHAIEEEIKKLNAEIDMMISKKAVIEDEDEFFRLDKELKTNQRQITKLQKSRQETQRTLKKLDVQVSIQLEHIKKMQLRIDDIRNIVETQEVSIEERNKLIEEVGQMQYILETKKQSECDLQERGHQIQVLLSRNIKQLTEKIAKFNSYIRQIMLDFEDLAVDIENLCLHQNSEMEKEDQIHDILIFLKRLQKHIANRIEEFSKRSDAFETQIKLISYEISEWIEPKTKEAMDSIKELQKRVGEVDRAAIAAKNYQKDQMNELAQRVRQTNESIEAFKKAIEMNRVEIVRTSKENEAMITLIKERFEESLTIRDSQLKRFQDALQHLRKKCIDATTLIK